MGVCIKMKNKILTTIIILSFILTISCVNAADNNTNNFTTIANDNIDNTNIMNNIDNNASISDSHDVLYKGSIKELDESINNNTDNYLELTHFYTYNDTTDQVYSGWN